MGKGPIKLNLGAGDKRLEGYINVDIVDERKGIEPDVICDITKLSEKFEEGFADEILAVHVIEHFYLWNAVDLLKEWVHVLKPGGTMILECPDLMKAVFHLLTNPQQPQLSMWALYGDPSWKDPLMCHKWAYTPQQLGQVMHVAGLVNIRQEPAEFKLKDLRDMRLVGDKPNT